MELVSRRTNEPLSISGQFSFGQADMDAAFDVGNPSPELQDLFYDVTGPKWAATPVSEKFALLSRVAALVDAAAAKAKNLNLSADPAEPK